MRHREPEFKSIAQPCLRIADVIRKTRLRMKAAGEPNAVLVVNGRISTTLDCRGFVGVPSIGVLIE